MIWDFTSLMRAHLPAFEYFARYQFLTKALVCSPEFGDELR